MAVDLTQLQAANDALTAAELSVASDVQTLTSTVASLQAIIADGGDDTAVQAAIDQITASINATVAKLSADAVPAPPSDTPPSDTPPSDTPPSDTPPSDTPPSDTPPSDTPPAEPPA